MNGVRLDKLLWMLRYTKTRTQAAEACQGGRVKMQGKTQKASKVVLPGDEISFSKSPFVLSFRILEIPKQRLPAKQLNAYRIDLTPPQTAVLSGGKVLRQGQRQSGTGRPTKKERRDLDEFKPDEDSI